MSSTIGIVIFVGALIFMIAFHEFGHFITARWAGVKVSRFFVGFGPTLWSTRRGRLEAVVDEDGNTVTGPDGQPQMRPETEVGVKALPLGGFVKVVGMSPAEPVAPADQPRSFQAAPMWKRAVVLAAGSATHFITAFVLLFVVFSIIGVPNFDRPTTTIDAVATELDGEASPASLAGLEPGDEIVAVNGRAIGRWDELTPLIQASPGSPLGLTVRSPDGTERTVELTPTPQERDGEIVGIIGVGPRYATERIGPAAGLWRSGVAITNAVVTIGQVAPGLFTPERLGLVGDAPDDERLISIVGAGRIAGDLASRASIFDLLALIVSINVFVALFNLVPLPPLDGGHLLFLGLEKVRGRPVKPETVARAMAVGFTLIMALALILLFNDIVRPPSLPSP